MRIHRQFANWVQRQWINLKQAARNIRHRSSAEPGGGARRAHQQANLRIFPQEMPYAKPFPLEGRGFKIKRLSAKDEQFLARFVLKRRSPEEWELKPANLDDIFAIKDLIANGRQDAPVIDPRPKQEFEKKPLELHEIIRESELKEKITPVIPEVPRQEVQQEIIPVMQKHVGASEVNADINAHLQLLASRSPPESRADFTRLVQIHEKVVSDSSDPQKCAQLAANVFGHEAFEGKQLEGGPALEGPGSENSIFRFMEGLAAFCDHLEKTGDFETLEKMKSIQEEYRSLYTSALLRRAIKNAASAPEKIRLQTLAAALLKADIEAVKDGKKERGVWLAGSNDHFVPMRYERDKETGLLRISCFNLGGGASAFQEKDFTGEKVKAEARLGKLITTPSGRQAVLCDEEFLSRHLDNLCKDVVDIAANKPLLSWISFLRDKVPVKGTPDLNLLLQSYYEPAGQQDPTQTVFVQKVQKIGDCTCRGQWALLRKEMDRVGVPADSYRAFKSDFERMNLERLPRQNPIKLGIPAQGGRTMSQQEVHRICWADHVRLSPKGEERLLLRRSTLPDEEKWKARIISLPFASAEGGTVPLSLEGLFNGKQRVVIGRAPDDSPNGLEENVSGYALGGSPPTEQDMSISRTHLELFVDQQGKLQAKVLGRWGIALENDKGIIIKHEAGETIEINAAVKAIYLNQQEADNPASPQRIIRFR